MKVIPPSTVYSPAETKRRLKERMLHPESHKLPSDKKRPRRPRKTVVTSVSIPPELVIRVKRDIGNGSFSAGVVKAAIYYLTEVVDKYKEQEKRYRE